MLFAAAGSPFAATAVTLSTMFAGTAVVSLQRMTNRKHEQDKDDNSDYIVDHIFTPIS